MFLSLTQPCVFLSNLLFLHVILQQLGFAFLAFEKNHDRHEVICFGGIGNSGLGLGGDWYVTVQMNSKIKKSKSQQQTLKWMHCLFSRIQSVCCNSPWIWSCSWPASLLGPWSCHVSILQLCSWFKPAAFPSWRKRCPTSLRYVQLMQVSMAWMEQFGYSCSWLGKNILNYH